MITWNSEEKILIQQKFMKTVKIKLNVFKNQLKMQILFNKIY